MKVRINWKNENPEIISVKQLMKADKILSLVQSRNTENRDYGIEIEHPKFGWMNDHDYLVVLKNPKAFQTFIILCRQMDDEIIYMQSQAEVVARNWQSAYEKLRRNGFMPYVDEYKPTSR